VPIYGFGEDEGLHFYAMQFIEGASLSEVIRSAGRPPTTEESPIGEPDGRGVARIIAEVADALAYAHRHGVLHRDIKPSNLLLDREGAVWVADFGLAKHEDEEAITATGDIVGTLRYMAPEQLNGHTDLRSDIYSLGLTLYELLALRPAYEEGRHGLLITAKTREAPRPLRSINPRIPADLETITLKACATDPADRYQTAGALAEDLTRFLEGRPIRARRMTAPERLWRWCRRNPMVTGLCSATFLLLLSVAIVFAVGNYRTRRALAHREREHARAETNLALAIRAFERIIENISSRGIAQPPDLNLEGVGIVAPETVLTVADAELLETLLAFFDRFANENGTDLKAESASARRRVGDIQQRLGRFVEAEATYRDALQVYTALSVEEPDAVEWIVARGTILNEIGETASRRGAFMLAMEQHVEARRLLESSRAALASKTGRFELARTLMLLCSIASRNGVDSLDESLQPGPPPGWRPPPEPGAPGAGRFAGPRGRMPRSGSSFPGDRREEWKDAIGSAIVLLQGLLAAEPGSPEYRLLLARSYREQARIARLGRDRALAEESLSTAIDHLDRLVTGFPTHPVYQAGLAEMLCTRLSFPGEPESDLAAVQRVERAVALSEELRAGYPHIPEYRFLSASALHRLASLAQDSGHPEQARDRYLLAIGFQEALTRQFPSVLQNSVALAESLQKLAEVERVLGHSALALSHLDAAITQLQRFPKGNAARFLPFLIRRLQDRRAAIATEAPLKPPEATDLAR
jgi:tetratricopeptide (TPR) repeat protein